MGPVVYVVGPYRGPSAWHIEENIRRAETIALEIAQYGAVPLCVHSMYRYFQGTLPDQFWLDATLKLLEKSDAMVLTYGWERSTGSRAERAAMTKWGRDDRVFDLSAYNREQREYDKLATWIAAWRAAQAGNPVEG